MRGENAPSGQQLQRFTDSLDSDRRAATIHHSSEQLGTEAGELAVAGDALYELGRNTEMQSGLRVLCGLARKGGLR